MSGRALAKSPALGRAHRGFSGTGWRPPFVGWRPRKPCGNQRPALRDGRSFPIGSAVFRLPSGSPRSPSGSPRSVARKCCHAVLPRGATATFHRNAAPRGPAQHRSARAINPRTHGLPQPPLGSGVSCLTLCIQMTLRPKKRARNTGFVIVVAVCFGLGAGWKLPRQPQKEKEGVW